jgi:hypothetical protein
MKDGKKKKGATVSFVEGSKGTKSTKPKSLTPQPGSLKKPR